MNATPSPLQQRLARFVLGAAAALALPVGQAHNLDTRATGIYYDAQQVALMSARAAGNQPLVQVGDKFWIVIKTTVGPGTTTGVGGYQTFYVPPGMKVIDAAYVLPVSTVSDPRGFKTIPMKGQSPIAIGAGPIGAKSTPELAGLTLPGTNGLGFVTAPMTAAGLHRGTLVGVYGDTGIFYSEDPRTKFWSYETAPKGTQPTRINNSGDIVGEFDAANIVGTNVLGVTTRFDMDQLLAYGWASGPIIDYPDQRGNAPWGLANVVPGPQSGYAWEFNLANYLAAGGAFPPTSPRNLTAIQAAIKIGPWKRIQYPGSQISKDQPGLISAALGYGSVDASGLGLALSESNPLPLTANAVRFAIGQLELGRPEYSAVRVEVLSTMAPACEKVYADAFGGDAGGTDNGKDHIWRYFDPTVVSLDPCVMLQKVSSAPIVKVGDTFSYTITFANNGSVDLPNIVLTDTLPSGLVYLSAVPAPTTVALPNLTWNVGTVPAQKTVTLTIYVRATGSGTLCNDIAARSGTTPVAIATDCTEVGLIPFLQVDKDVTPTTVAPGGTVTYTVNVDNLGTGPNGVPLILTEYLPPGFTYGTLLSATINGAVFTPAVNTSNPNQPVFTINTGIQAGKSLVLKFTANVSPTQAVGTYCNGVELAYSGRRQPPVPDACVSVGGGRIGDFVWRDWNGDGLQDFGEEGIPGVTVQLWNDNDGDGKFSTGDTLVTTTTTDANGAYLFTGLVEGNYVVRIPTPPANYTNTGNPPGGVGNPVNEGRAIIDSPNASVLTVDFGYQYNPGPSVPSGVIGDTVYSDLSKDGEQDVGETGIPYITVRLYEDTNGNGVVDPGDLLIKTTSTSDGTTDVDGDTELDPPGTYLFKVLDPALKYIAVVDATDPDLATFFGIPYTATTPISVAVNTIPGNPVDGYDFLEADFGFFGSPPSSIGDLVFLDVNRDGLYNSGDLPLANITVQLYLDDNGDGIAQPGELFDTTVTDLNGLYLFDNLGAGRYIVRVLGTDPDLPAGTVGTIPQFIVNLAAGQNFLDADFPFVRLLGKTVDKTYETADGILTYTLSPYYPGNVALTSVQVTDATPAGTTYFGNDSPPATSEPTIGGTGTVTWNLGSTVAAANGAGSTPRYVPTAIVLSSSSDVDDTYIQQGAATTWVGGANELQTRPEATKNKVTLIKFNQSTIANLAVTDVIDRAVLRVMVTGARANTTVTLRRMITDWTEGTSAANGATWNDPNGTGTAGVWAGGGFSSADYDTTVSYGSFSSFANGQTLEFDVTALVRGWRGGSIPNRGVALIATGTDNGDLKYRSSEGSAAATPGPRLVIAYSRSNSQPATTDYTVRDQFGTVAYNNDDGTSYSSHITNRWAGGWIELGGDGSPSAGSILITGSRLRVKEAAGLAIHRSANLAGATTATLTLDMANNTLDDSNDRVYLQASVNGGTSWTTLDTYTKGTAAFTGKSFNLISLLGSVNKDTRIRFLSSAGKGKSKTIDFDNVTITYRTPSGAVTSTQLAADTALLTGTRNVTVTMTVQSSVAVSVTPPTDLTPILTGTATATKISGPTPGSGVADAAGVTFQWVYQVNSGSGIGSVRFQGTPTTATSGFTFGAGTSPSVLTTAPLTFQVKVNSPTPVGPICNLGNLTGTGPSLPAPSPQVCTATSASIGDRVWLDTNGNGAQNTGEPGIAGVTVYVYADADSNGIPDGPAIGTAVTDSAGNYLISGLAAGKYLVTYDGSTAPSGHYPTTATVFAVTLVSGQQYLDADFGLKPPPPNPDDRAKIGDRVWLDANNNGVVDAGETGIANVDVRLYVDSNNNGVIDFGEPLIATTSTDATGYYLFSGLNAGNYIVDVVETDVDFPAGTVLVSGGSPVTSPPSGGVWKVSPIAGQTILTADFGYNYTGLISGYLWYDTNADGLKGVGDTAQPAPNGTVVLYADTNNNGVVDDGEVIIRTFVTCNGTPEYPCGPGQTPGVYEFPNLPPGSYVVKVSEQEVPSPVTGNVNTMVLTTPEKYAVTLTPGDMVKTDRDYGFVEAALVTGHVFHDVNHNGIFDDPEPPLPNVTVWLYGPGPDGIIGTPDDFGPDGIPGTADDVALRIATTTTNGDGEYKFIITVPGPYRIVYDTADPDIPAGLTIPTTPLDYIVSVLAGVEYSGFDFGRDNAGKIGDTIFGDINSSGAQNPGEPGLAGVTVELWLDADNSNTVNTGDTLLATTTTDANGNYEFPGLADGNYVVRVLTSTLPGGYSTTPTAKPPTEWVSGSQAGATIVGGNTVLDRDFGYPPTVTTYSISGNVWNDNGAGGGTAGNGTRDGAEPGLPGVKVTITVDPDGAGPNPPVVYTVYTDASGNYTLAGVPSGAAVNITVDTTTLPSTAFVQTGDPDGTLDSQNSFTMPAANVTNKNFGYREQFGSIAGTSAIGNGNGEYEAGLDIPLAGSVITLRWAGPDGILNTSDDVVYPTVTTGPTGAYSFTGLLPGVYEITETNPPGYVSIADRDGGNPDSIILTLGVGQNVTGRDFENVLPDPVIGDYIWLDENGDGVQDAGEAGIPNVVVYLFGAGPDNVIGTSDDNLVAWTVTDSDGGYLFKNLSPNTPYRVLVDVTTLPAGLAANQTYDPDGVKNHETIVTTPLTGEGIFTADFGYNWAPTTDVTGGTGTGAIGDRVWVDVNGNGRQDPGEPGLGGAVVGLVGAGADGLFGTLDDVVLATTVTAPDGSYIFDGLAAGAYRVQVVPPTGYTPSGDPDQPGVPCTVCDNVTTAPIIVAPGDVYVNADFGYLPPAAQNNSVSGVVFMDLDANGVKAAPDTVVPGVTVALILDTNGNGVWEVGEPIVATTTTDAAGAYAFGGVPDGKYIVWVNDVGNILTDLKVTVDPDPTKDGLTAVDLDSAGTNPAPVSVTDRDFGYTPIAHFDTAGLIGDTVYLDLDASGAQNPGEPGLEGVTVQLWNLGETVKLAETHTDENGKYYFGGLAAGTYVVKVVTATLPGGGAGMANTGDPDGGNDSKSTVTLSSGQIKLDQDFGYRTNVTPNTIGGTVWVDTNANGTLDGSEAGRYAGVTVALYEDVNNNGVLDAGDRLVNTAVTDASGNYSFTGLPNGNYLVDVTDTANLLNGLWKSTGPTPGADNNSQPDPYPVYVSGGATNNTADFGYYGAPGSLGNWVWDDVNKDGIQDGGELGIPNVLVTLTISWPGGGTTVLKTLTDASGYYRFDNLLLDENHDGVGAGEPTYLISVATPSGHAPTLVDQGSDDTVDSDNHAGQSASTTQGVFNDTYDFGYYKVATVSGHLFLDLNGDGDQDPGEPNLAGVSVLITPSSGPAFTVVTDGNGNWVATVPPGATTADVVEATLPPGVVQTAGTDPTTVTAVLGVNTFTDDDGYQPSTPPTTVYGHLFIDTNGNGVQDPGEPNLANVDVVITKSDSTTVTVSTDANGNWVAIVPPGLTTANVDETDPQFPTGFIQTAGTDPTTVTAVSGTATNAGDDGYKPPTASDNPTTVYGHLFIDTNGNGVQDAGEPNLPNVNVIVTDGSGTQVVTTDANGNWVAIVTPGPVTANVDETDPDFPAGSIQTAGTDPTTVTAVVNTAVNAGDDGYYVPPVNSIGDRIWLDEDGDGVQDAGEAGIGNVLVKLYRPGYGPDGIPGNADDSLPIAQTVTDTEGGYRFTGLPRGIFVVEVDTTTMPAGLAANPTADRDGTLDHKTTVNLTAGGEVDDADFGYNWAPTSDVTGGTGTGAIGDRLWIDANGNGKQDLGEVGLGGVLVTLYSAGADGIFGTGDDPTPLTTTSKPDGSYIFDGLAAGVYRVEVNNGVNPPGYTQTGDPDQPGVTCTTCDNQTTTPIILAPGDVYVNADFGYQPPAGPGNSGVIGDTVWVDVNLNGGVDAGEPRLAGVTVALILDYNGDGRWQPAGADGIFGTADDEPIIGQTITDANGFYQFTGLPLLDWDGIGDPNNPDADYLVWVNDTAGVLGALVPTYDFDGANPTAGFVTGLGISAVGVDGAYSRNDQDFGYAPAGQTASTGVIGDTIFLDRNGNSTFEPGEGLEGVAVQLFNAAGTTLLATTFTDENGRYFFGGLAPSTTYTVKVVTSTLPPGLNNTVDPDGGVANQSVVTLGASGAALINLLQDFGYAAATPNTIGGTIWVDTNADGTLNAGETGRYAGVTVVLKDANGNIVGTTTTDSAGNYSFTGLPDGTYTVNVTDTVNVLNGLWKSNGTSPGSDGNSQVEPYTVTVTGGAVNTTADFGYYGAPAALGDLVWRDNGAGSGIGGNGIQDGTEPGIPGVEVTLTITWPASGGTTVVKTTTDANGNYSFGNLLLDENHSSTGGSGPTFVITVATPSGLTPSPVDQGSNDALDSDGTTINATVAQGETNNTYDSGFYGTYNIAGKVVDDGSSGNGLIDIPGDTPVSGVEIKLYRDNNNNGVLDGGDTLVDTQTTNVSGDYTFTSVPEGNYLVVETVPSGKTAVTDSDGDANGKNVIDVTLSGGNSNGNNFLLKPAPPTAARLAYFKAVTAGEGVVRVTWGTLVENGTLGFRVERSTADGGWQRLTAQMIPATGWDGRPQTYALVDADPPAVAGVLYRLLETDLSGRERVLAVAAVEAGMTTGIARTETGLSLSVRGVPNASVTVQTAEAVEGPWTTVQTVTLDGAGGAVLNLGVDVSGPARFYRVVSE